MGTKRSKLPAVRSADLPLLYRLIAKHFGGLVAHTAGRGGILPRFVQREFDGFARRGILVHACCRLDCDDCRCGQLVAFSRKRRASCPSCGERRMADEAAHLVDQGLPPAPVRLWVLSLPDALRFAVAFYAKLCGQMPALFVRAVPRFYRHHAKAHLVWRRCAKRRQARLTPLSTSPAAQGSTCISTDS